ARDAAEEQIEGDAALPGKRITINDGDIDGDGVADTADGFDADGDAGTADDLASGLRFTPLVLELAHVAAPASATVRFNYDAAAPGSTGGTLRIWRKDGGAAR